MNKKEEMKNQVQSLIDSINKEIDSLIDEFLDIPFSYLRARKALIKLIREINK